LQIVIEPLDILFFRDGRPFNQGEDHFAEGYFPPTPRTFQGIIRSKVLSEYGIDFSDRSAVLSANDTLMANLDLVGPYPALREASGWEPLFPTPSDWWKDQGSDRIEFHFCLEPGLKNPMRGDLGDERAFPTFPDEFKDRKGGPVSGWATAEGLRFYLKGSPTDGSKVKSQSDLWTIEHRTGIGRDRKRAISKEGELYTFGAVRLKEGRGLWANINGLERSFAEKSLIGLGGEGRAGRCLVLTEEKVLFPVDESVRETIDESGRFKLILLQPAKFIQGWLPDGINPDTWHGQLGGLEAELVSACVGKPMKIGGWDMLEKRSKPMSRYVPPGSVYYFRVEKGNGHTVLANLHNKKVGVETPDGFGHAVVGSW
jgi:CRISPR-associated protein Cmr3